MNRNITGTIRKTDGTVWAGATVNFELERSSFDEEAQYPVNPVRVTTDSGGLLSAVLWVDENSHFPTRYICTLPDASQFRFNLSEGEEPIDLNELRESAIEDDAPTQSDLVAFLPIIRREASQTAEAELAELSAEIATKASQSALNTTNTNLATLGDEVDTKADQSALNTTNTNLAALGDEVDTKANQSALNTTNTNLATAQQGVTDANTAIATKANQSALNTTNTNLAALGDEVDSKADQSALNTTNTNLAALGDEVDTKANQSALNTTNTNLATTQQGLTDANTAIATKASQTALNNAITALQTAIGDAQDLLEGLIDLKADALHSHLPGQVVAEELFNSIAFFNADGNLTNSDKLTYIDEKMGVGTGTPDYPFEVKYRHPDTHIVSKVAADLYNSSTNLKLINDTADSEVKLSFVYPEATATVQGDKRGDMSIGANNSIHFNLVSGTTDYRGLFSGVDGPTTTEFPDHGSFGFYMQEHGDEFQFVFNYLGDIKIISTGGFFDHL